MPEKILRRLSELPRFKDIITVAWGQQKFNENNKKTVFTKASLPRGARVGKRYARFAHTGAVTSHAVDWQDHYVDTDLFSRDRKQQFRRPKMIFGCMAPRLRVAFDDQGFFLGHLLFASGARDGLSFPYLTGVLNSQLGNFLFVSASVTPSAPSVILSATKNLDALRPRALEPSHLAGLPVLIPTEDPGRKLAGFIEANVLGLIHVKQARRILRNVWTDLAGFHAQRYGTLAQLLCNRLPGQKQGWVKKLVPSFATLTRRTRRFRHVRLQGDKDEALLRLYGHTDAGEEIVLGEAEFTDRELMLCACLSAASRPPRRARSATAARIMSETVVPLAGDDISEGAHKIMAQLTAKAPKAFAAEGVPAVLTDLARIDHEIHKLEAILDAEVFHIYGLSLDQAQAVLKSVRTSHLDRQRIETFFQRIADGADEKTEKPVEVGT
jgi:hypothetical protein